MGQWQPGDALMTTRLGLPAVWWYGMIPISDEAGAGKVLRDGSPVYEAGLTNDCPSRQLEDALQNHRRVLLYLGFDGVSADRLRVAAQPCATRWNDCPPAIRAVGQGGRD